MAAAGKITIKSSGHKHDGDKAKKIYRSVCDIIQRLDEVQVRKDICRDAFLPDIIFLRDRLQEYCEKLMFSWPLEYGRKVEEVLWRKGFYDIIQLIKRNIKDVRGDSSIEKAYKTHLSSAMGYYNCLLSKIQSEFNVDLDIVVDMSRILKDPFAKTNPSMKPENEAGIKNWAVQASFRCLLYLGDIARYQHDYDGVTKMIAQRYYYQAISLCPGAGMPYNQLGTLAGSAAYSFHAAYYYLRCCTCTSPFEGCQNNLTKLFERNRKRLAELDDPGPSEGQNHLPHNYHHRHLRRNASAYNRSKDGKKFLVRFIHLMELFYCRSKDYDKTKIYDLCQLVLDDFNKCLNNLSFKSLVLLRRDRGFPSEDRHHVVDDEIIFKIFTICLAFIHILSKKGNDLVAAAIAFSLAMFSHALNSVATRLRPSSFDLDEGGPDNCTSSPITKPRRRDGGKVRPVRKYCSHRAVASERKPTFNDDDDDDDCGSHTGGDKGENGDGGGDGDCSKRFRQNSSPAKYDDDADNVKDYECQEKEGGETSEKNKPSKSEEIIIKKKLAKMYLRRRRRRGGSEEEEKEDGDQSDDDDDGDDLSSEVESEADMDNLSDLDLLSSSDSDNGSGMESQPENGDRKKREEPVRPPAYHKEGNSPTDKVLAKKEEKSTLTKNEKNGEEKVNKKDGGESGDGGGKSDGDGGGKSGSDGGGKSGNDGDGGHKKNSKNENGKDESLENISGSQQPQQAMASSITTTTTTQSDNSWGSENFNLSMCDVSGTWMSNAAVFLGRTLKMSYLEDNTSDFSDIISGSKNVPVPPGFEKSLELQHVMEITEKLANFNIETDTDVNQSDAEECTPTNSDAEAELERGRERKRQEEHEKETTRLLGIVATEKMLEYIKVYCDWMTVNPMIVTSCAKISSSIWYRLATLINILPTEKDIFESDLCTKDPKFSRIFKNEIENETNISCSVFPLLEDIHLRDFPPLKVAHQKINFQLDEFINRKQESAIRLCRLRMLSRSLAMLDTIDFTYDRETDTFCGPAIVPTNSIKAVTEGEPSKPSSTMMKQTAMMKNLAQLRMKSQTSKERSIHELIPHGCPVYLVLDAETIYEGLKLIKKLAEMDQFKVIVPEVVLVYLDSIKNTNKNTLRGIEWVEEEICKKGKVRLQKKEETCLSPDVRLYSKEPMDYVASIIDCCQYFLTHSQPTNDDAPNNSSSSSSSLSSSSSSPAAATASTTPAAAAPMTSGKLNSVCLLTWMKEGGSELPEQVSRALDDSVRKGIRIRSISDFYRQWNQLSSSVL